MGSVVGGSLGGHGDVRNDGPIEATGLDPTQKLAAGWGFPFEWPRIEARGSVCLGLDLWWVVFLILVVGVSGGSSYQDQPACHFSLFV